MARAGSVRPKFKVRDRDLGWKRIMKDVRTYAGKAYVTVGILESKANREAEPSGLTNTELALVHEFGSRDGRVPERSFLRATFDGNRKKYEARVREYVGLMLDGKLEYVRALRLLGLEHASDIKAYMAEMLFPPLADATVARKGSSQLLIDTGQLRASVTYAVVLPGEGGQVTRKEDR